MVMAVIFLATEFEDLMETGTIYPILVATVLFGFMYAFRRSQRIQLDKYMDEKMRQMEEEDNITPNSEQQN